jgi:cell pole-organizing protein PopZ
MAEPSKDTDQSMEDILQSIKRIIADEGEPTATSAGSDVLELTELLAEDVAVDLPAEAESKPIESMSLDEIMAAPISAMPQATPAPVVEAPPMPEPELEPAAIAMPAPAAPAAPASDHLMSDDAFAASAAALKDLAHSASPITSIGGSPTFRSGTCVEDLVVEALKPMLKEWLDGNLPALVKALVEKEVRRLSGQ